MGTYSVIVGNIGTVRSEVGRKEALQAYKEYKTQSETGYGRASGEDVYMMKGDEIVYEYTGTFSRDNEEL